jgi:hypothetical protein
MKTGVKYKIPMLNIPQMIIEKYRGRGKRQSGTSGLHITYYNRHLKEIGKICDITRRMSSHQARHMILSFELETSELQMLFL